MQDEQIPITERADLGKALLRAARQTGDLDAVVRFYRDGLGLDVLYEFHGHDGFDGVMLGREGGRLPPGVHPQVGPRGWRGPRPRTTCWSSTCPTGPRGRRRWTACSAKAT